MSAEGRRVQLVRERAGSWPFSARRHPHFNLWTATATSALMIEAMHADVDLVLVDRGLFDALCWMEWYRRLGHLTPHEHRAIGGFLRVGPLRKMIHLVLVMTVEPEVAIQRELATRPPAMGYTPGTVVNTETLALLNDTIAAVANRHRNEFNLHELDTTAMSPEETLQRVAGAVRALLSR
ncbi:MAG: hypothetical protein E6J41_18390 [Chloroflexi bacterium]|nr:MAG: hypothetical protein E6J41_18390 [Chloroflexota bacterium]